MRRPPFIKYIVTVSIYGMVSNDLIYMFFLYIPVNESLQETARKKKRKEKRKNKYRHSIKKGLKNLLLTGNSYNFS